MSNGKEIHRDYIPIALGTGSYDWPPHACSRVGPLLLYYIQGMLMSVWVIGTDVVEHVPIVWPQDIATYRKHQRKFERSVLALRRKG